MNLHNSFEARCCQTPVNIINEVARENDNYYQAKNILNKASKRPNISEQLSMAMIISISALNKNIPQRRKHWTDDYKDYYFCPSCEYEDGVEYNQLYCDVCGQKLSWE